MEIIGVVTGIVITVALGRIVGRFLEEVVPKPEQPSSFNEKEWLEFVGRSAIEDPKDGGRKEKWGGQIGFIGRLWWLLFKEDRECGQIEEAGRWMGVFERLLCFLAFAIEGYSIIGGWFAFKVAAKWNAWKDIIRVPDTLERKHISTLEYYQAKREYGTWELSRFLIGTLLNVLIGFTASLSIQYPIHMFLLCCLVGLIYCIKKFKRAI
ncbi:MAG: hypothetical protein WAW37_02950 [Syntrophobacteraceae bacterium]